MCDRCDALAHLEVEVNAAVAGEVLPRVCSVPECGDVPVARWAPTPDDAQLLCVECLACAASSAAVVGFSRLLASHGIGIHSSVGAAVAERLTDEFMDELEVLS